MFVCGKERTKYAQLLETKGKLLLEVGVDRDVMVRRMIMGEERLLRRTKKEGGEEERRGGGEEGRRI